MSNLASDKITGYATLLGSKFVSAGGLIVSNVMENESTEAILWNPVMSPRLIKPIISFTPKPCRLANNTVTFVPSLLTFVIGSSTTKFALSTVQD